MNIDQSINAVVSKYVHALIMRLSRINDRDSNQVCAKRSDYRSIDGALSGICQRVLPCAINVGSIDDTWIRQLLDLI